MLERFQNFPIIFEILHLIHRLPFIFVFNPRTRTIIISGFVLMLCNLPTEMLAKFIIRNFITITIPESCQHNLHLATKTDTKSETHEEDFFLKMMLFKYEHLKNEY